MSKKPNLKRYNRLDKYNPFCHVWFYSSITLLVSSLGIYGTPKLIGFHSFISIVCSMALLIAFSSLFFFSMAAFVALAQGEFENLSFRIRLSMEQLDELRNLSRIHPEIARYLMDVHAAGETLKNIDYENITSYLRKKNKYNAELEKTQKITQHELDIMSELRTTAHSSSLGIPLPDTFRTLMRDAHQDFFEKGLNPALKNNDCTVRPHHRSEFRIEPLYRGPHH
ncbi:hypothetical protein ACJU26_08705 [Acidithiobacillus sp. M4-SHS-6]|uniref:hypothetical protein n=1 Tax=Acidithiobacillus sp. M4-SHS-6 TaxID=3383024 RepID=UPI0039BE79FF